MINRTFRSFPLMSYLESQIFNLQISGGLAGDPNARINRLQQLMAALGLERQREKAKYMKELANKEALKDTINNTFIAKA